MSKRSADARRSATIDDAVLFSDLGKLRVSLQHVKDEVERGGSLQITHSKLSDPTDSSTLYLNGQQIGKLEGY